MRATLFALLESCAVPEKPHVYTRTYVIRKDGELVADGKVSVADYAGLDESRLRLVVHKALEAEFGNLNRRYT